ncbi:hypothetical protein [Pyxidicoccus sp. MSG2]|uniref:hypothetical protein n=1 Tax=Pyxidicoccus sp. MSG2 TaxID=2996790 RepID=UPI002270C75C|nr:hypothetical protein [Pyxidicoccus sp. MSG2]MCY1023980.1 hypothetical protein [Pyxidicoccus sp. MSG2]
MDASIHTGTRRDDDGRPVCEECLSALGNWKSKDYPELPAGEQAPCWSCDEMLRAQENDELRVSRERSMQ